MEFFVLFGFFKGIFGNYFLDFSTQATVAVVFLLVTALSNEIAPEHSFI
jgi:hypothetical protein